MPKPVLFFLLALFSMIAACSLLVGDFQIQEPGSADADGVVSTSDGEPLGANEDAGGAAENNSDEAAPDGPVCPSKWYDCQWAYRKQITLHSPFPLSSNLTNFPLLLSIADNDLRQVAAPSGKDIRFIELNWGLLPHEIERFDQATGTLVAWVKVPELSSSTSQTLFMYFGNPQAIEPGNQADVWDAQFVGVWHLGQDPTATAPQYLDSTSNDNDGWAITNKDYPWTLQDRVPGKIGFAASIYDQLGHSKEIEILDSPSLGLNQGATWEGWIKPTQVEPVNNYLLYKYNSYFLSSMRSYDSTPNSYIFVDSNWRSLHSETGLSPGQWNHLAATYDNLTHIQKIYVNGEPAKEHELTGLDSYNLEPSAEWLYLGRTDSGAENTIDEVRISNIARDEDWLKASYENQSNPQNFYTVGELEKGF